MSDANNRTTDSRVLRLQQRRATLLAYLREKLDDNDMHGVQDAASDIREIDAKLSVLHA